MFDPKKLDEVVRRLGEGLPETLTEVRSDFEKTLRLGVQQVLASMDIVTREDFEVQRLVLERTRERLEALEKRVAALEAERKIDVLDVEV
ncbi:MAG: accessory factor UbiK family protein [Pseudomonadota bacterium]